MAQECEYFILYEKKMALLVPYVLALLPPSMLVSALLACLGATHAVAKSFRTPATTREAPS